MYLYMARRVLQVIPVLFGISIIVFALINLTPGDPITILLGEDATIEEAERLTQQLGLDKPWHIRYIQWVGGVVRGDWGQSYRDNRDVLPTIMGFFPATLELVLASMALSVGVGVTVGIISAVRQDTWFDHVTRIGAFLGLSMPNFWVGIMLILLFAYYFRLLPASGRDGFATIILPAVTLGTSGMATITRITRSAMLEVIRQDYIRTARAKGLHERAVIYKYALRGALTAVITIVGLQLGFRLGGTVVVESVFAWPGIGRFAYQRMMQRDYPMIMGNLLIFATLFCLVNLLVDMTYALVDPRIRYE